MRGSKTRESGAVQLGVSGARWERGLAERSDTRLGLYKEIRDKVIISVL